MVLVDAIFRLVDGALRAQNNVVQNRRKSRRLADCLEAILPPLRTIEASESKIPVAHRETLEKLQNVVEDAKVLLEKQCKKSYMSQLVSSSSVKEHFNDITQRLQAHMQALNLSVAALHRVDANTRDAEDAADVQELQEEIRKMIESNQDDLRSQLAELDEGQQGRAREMLSKLTEGHEQLRRDISEDLRKIVLEMSPAQHADSSLPHIDMATDLRSIGRGGDDVLGSGGFGEVKKMLWMAGGAIDVAVKVLHQRRPSPKALKELRKEAEAMHAMRHPNIIQLYGASLTPPHVCLVLEYAPHGSLEDVLEKEGAPSGAAVWRERFFIASDIVKGLIYLHNRKVLHLDIKSGNVMLFDHNSRRGGKLADFGLSFIKNETSAGGTVAIKTSAGTVNWKSPELFRKGGQATRASDIYSCACVMYELASGAIPWDGEGAGEVTGMVSSGDRPDKPKGCIEGFWNLIEHGWAQEPAKRIALVDALDSLETLVKATGGGETDPAPDPPAPPLPPPPLPPLVPFSRAAFSLPLLRMFLRLEAIARSMATTLSLPPCCAWFRDCHCFAARWRSSELKVLPLLAARATRVWPMGAPMMSSPFSSASQTLERSSESELAPGGAIRGAPTPSSSPSTRNFRKSESSGSLIACTSKVSGWS